jgi:UDP-N-acetylglucosamine acyltransferase
MAYTHVAHDCKIGDQTVFVNCASVAGHVTVGDHAILSAFTIVYQYCAIGAHCFCAIGSVIIKDVPPFITVSGHMAKPYGINIEGLKRRGFSSETLRSLREAYKILYKSKLTLNQAVVQLKVLQESCAEVGVLLAFLDNSTRGIAR